MKDLKTGGIAIMLHSISDHKDGCSVEKLERVIKEYNIIPAKEWYELAINGNIGNKSCLTFDDGYLSQYELAYPVMKKHGLTGFFFIFTEPIVKGENSNLLKHQYIRNNVKDLYKKFFNECEKINGWDWNNIDNGYLKEFEFYNQDDRWYRYIRDKMLTEKEFNNIMDSFDIDVPRLHMNWDELENLDNNSNIIGLHSHTHPRLAELKPIEQYSELSENYNFLGYRLYIYICSASYPFGSHNEHTFDNLSDLGIKLCFANSPNKQNNLLNFSRTDISDL